MYHVGYPLKSDAPQKDPTFESFIALVLHFVFSVGFWIGTWGMAVQLAKAKPPLLSPTAGFVAWVLFLMAVSGAGHWATARYLDNEE